LQGQSLTAKAQRREVFELEGIVGDWSRTLRLCGLSAAGALSVAGGEMARWRVEGAVDENGDESGSRV